jgi:hypothetical protein
VLFGEAEANTRFTILCEDYDSLQAFGHDQTLFLGYAFFDRALRFRDHLCVDVVGHSSLFRPRERDLAILDLDCM